MSLGRIKRVTARQTVHLLALAFVLVAVNIYLTVRSARGMFRNQDMVAHRQDVLKNLHLLLAQLREAENGALGYEFTGIDRFLDPYYRSLPVINAELGKLKDLTKDSPTEQRNFPDLEKDITRRLDLLAQGIEARHKPDFSVEDESVRLENGKLVMDDIRLILTNMETEERRLLALRQEDTNRSSQRTVTSFLLTSALNLLLIAFVYRLLWLERLARTQTEAAANRTHELQKTTDAALAQFRATFNQAAVGMAHVGLDGSWLLVNQKLCDILGYTADELKRLTFQKLTHPEDLANDLANVQHLLAGEIQTYDMEKRYLTKDGNVVYAHLNVSLLRDAQGAPLYFISAVQDITDKKRIESERQQLVRKLINSEKLASAGRMANTLAHEINNPLSAVVNSVYLLERDAGLTESAQQLVAMASRELSRISSITRTTLSFYRPSSRTDSASVPEMLDEVLQLYSNKARDLKIIVTTDYAESTKTHAFPKVLRQVFSNLVINALEAMPRGGQLKVRTRLTTAADGGTAISVIISDNGAGIIPEHRTGIFEPFFTTKGEKGTGLGLWVTRGIVADYGGSLRLRSGNRQPRRGTTMRIVLPVGKNL